MAGIVKRDFESPDDTYDFVHGRSLVVRVGEVVGTRLRLVREPPRRRW